MILIDPMRTTASYHNNLYSREFFKLVKQAAQAARAVPGLDGRFLGLSPHAGRGLSQAADVWVFGGDGVFSGLNEPLVENDQRATAILAKYPPAMRPGMREDGDYMGDESYVREDTAGCPTSRDWKPVMEYYFWRECSANGGRKEPAGSRNPAGLPGGSLGSLLLSY